MPAENLRYTMLPDLLARLNELAPSRRLGGLQALRRDVKGFSRLASRTVFPSAPPDPTWFHHVGGRTELQFNVGYDVDDAGARVLRHGLAFSLETSQSVHEPLRELDAAIAHFNDYVRVHADELGDMRVWAWVPDGGSGARTPSRPVGPLLPEECREDVFVVLGKLGPADPDEAGVTAILDDLDRLLPLYEYVLRGCAAGGAAGPVAPHPAAPGPMLAGTSMQRGKVRAVVQRAARLVEVDLRHRAIQEALYEEMKARFGPEAVRHEHPTAGGGRVDLRVREGARIVYYEIKTAATARACIREALGQLLEYAHAPGAEHVDELVVASDRPLTPDADDWLRVLTQKYGLPIRYYEVELVEVG